MYESAPPEDAEFVIPEGSIVEVGLKIRLPAGATEKQVEEWLRHTLGRAGSIDTDNPLYPQEPEFWGPTTGFWWQDTGRTGRVERYDEQATPTGKTYRERYLETRRDA